MPPQVTREEICTWQHTQDVQKLIRTIRAESIPPWSSDGPSPIEGRLAELEEHLEWFVEAAEERDALKLQLRCEACGKDIPKGTGLEKNGKLTPLCPSCQSKRIGEAT